MLQFIFSKQLWLCGKVLFEGQLRIWIFICASLLGEAEKERDKLGVLHIANLVKLDQLKVKFVVSEVWIILSPHKKIKEGIQDVCL